MQACVHMCVCMGSVCAFTLALKFKRQKKAIERELAEGPLLPTFTAVVLGVFADRICLRFLCPDASICTSISTMVQSIILCCWKSCSCWTVLAIDSDTVSYLCQSLHPHGRQAGMLSRASLQEQLQTWHGTVHPFMKHLKLWKYGLHYNVHKGRWRTRFTQLACTF